MSQTLFKRGTRYTWVNNTGSAVLAGAVVILNSGTSGYLGVALTDIAIGATGQLSIGGPDERVHTLAKKVGDVFTDAVQLYWDATNKYLTTTSSGNTKAARSYGVFASAAATAQGILNA